MIVRFAPPIVQIQSSLAGVAGCGGPMLDLPGDSEDTQKRKSTHKNGPGEPDIAMIGKPSPATETAWCVA